MKNRFTFVAVALGLVFALGAPVDLHAATKKKKPPVDSSDDSSDDQKKTTDDDTPAPKKRSADDDDAPSKKKPADNGDAKPDKDATDAPATSKYGPNATVEPEKISEFATQPARVQQLIRDAMDLTRQNLTYTFGSADPASGGMDCSGTIYHLLQTESFKDVPRDSGGQYLWARKSGAFYPVLSKSADSPEFKELLPGDLMFWTGTYQTGRDIPVSHVMLYLGKEKGTGKRIMFGASDGRSYNGVQRWGVSVFDFKMPKADPANPEKAKVDFVGFARIPGLRSEAAVSAASDEAPAEMPKKKAAASEDVKASAASDVDTPKPKNTPGKSTKKKKKPVSDSD
jgi:cell wall-associated NlpC family hydrolase